MKPIPAGGNAQAELVHPGNGPRPVRVLVVDDSHAFVGAVRSFLASIRHLEFVGSAADGREALQQVDQVRPDLVLMDCAMPVMDGLAATRELRRRGLVARILMVTMLDVEALSADAREAGVDAIASKGDFFEALESHVRAWFGVGTDSREP